MSITPWGKACDLTYRQAGSLGSWIFEGNKMKSAILADAQAAPDLFRWNGPIERRQIEEWVVRHNWVIPADLLEFWTTTGGGEILETERFLPPLVSANGEEEIPALTGWCRDRSMPEGLVVFHEGFGFSAIRCVDGAYVWLDPDVRLGGEYRSLDDWYSHVLRAEYATQYRLPPPASGA